MTKKNKEKSDEKIKFFIEDAILFSLWIFSNPKYYPKKGYFGVSEISPLSDWHCKRVFNFLKLRLKMAGVAFPKIGCYSDIPEKELKLPVAEELGGYDTEEQKKIQSATEKFVANDFGLEEVKTLLPFCQNIHHWIYFQPTFSKADVHKLLKQIDEYIDDFLNNVLFVYDRNYLIFEKQKQIFIGRVRKMSALEKYGKNFVISSDEYNDISKNSGFLFIHTLYALLKLKYIDVIRIWYERDTLYEKHTFYANIVVFDTFIDEASSSFRKDNPAIIFQEYDEKLNILKFAGKEIELSKKKKETDAVLLIKTLLKDQNRWWFNDEVAEDWDIATSDETSKNKAYFAARKINEAVKMETGIDDFIDHNTKKFRINPKYIKS